MQGVQACRRVCPAAGAAHTPAAEFQTTWLASGPVTAASGAGVGYGPGQWLGRHQKLGSQVGAASEHSARHWPGTLFTQLLHVLRGQVSCRRFFPMMFIILVPVWCLYFPGYPPTEARQRGTGGTVKSFIKVWVRGSGCGVAPCRQRTHPRDTPSHSLQARAPRSGLKQPGNPLPHSVL